MIDNRAVGRAIAALRQNRGMTQQQLAAALNVSHQAVSKWENGAALPDVQTLMELSRLFGITMEQLLSGELPEDRVEAKSPLEEPMREIGNFFNDVVNGIMQSAKNNEPDGDKDDDGAQEAQAEPAEAEEAPNPEPLDLEKLLQMAPFMSRPAVDALLMEHREQLTAADIARFAPFISRDCLEKLIQNPETEITWETLQRIAPFLKREMVDRLANLAARGSKFVQDAAGDAQSKPGEDLGRAIGDVSQTIGKGVGRMVRRAAKLGEEVASGVSEAFNSIVECAQGRDERVKALRRAACERALQDEKWDWLAEHIGEIDDEALLKAIADKANGLGMHEWVLEHLNGYADHGIIDAAIESGDWAWLGDHVWQFEDEYQQKTALAAAKAENWLWLSTYCEQLALGDCAGQIALAAYSADQRALAQQMAEHCLNEEQREALANAAVSDEDYDFLSELTPQLTPEYFGRLCMARAQAGQWDIVERFVESADHASVEKMTELAIAEGNFEAIDLLSPYL